MEHLFGHLCSSNVFSHDIRMRQTVEDQISDSRPAKRARYDTQASTQSSQETSIDLDYIDSGAINRTHQNRTEDQKPETGHSEEAARNKRNEIRRAHHYLHEHAEPGLFEIGPLPEAWPTATEDNFDVAHEVNESTEDDDDDERTPVPEQHDSKTSTISIVPESVPDIPTNPIITTDGAMAPYPINAPTDSQQTDLLTVSISESAFDSPGRITDDSRPDQELSLARSRSARMAAYLAARQDTFTAWTDVSLVSADNHAEEEIEL